MQVNNPLDSQSVGLYLRVSTDEQAQEGTSIETQREFLRAWAKLQGLAVYREYSDPGYSGSSEDRPGFQQMLRDAEAGHIQVAAVSKLDRFMRDARLMLNAIEALEQQGVAFVAVKEGVDTSDKGTGRLVLTILAAIAEWERDRILERTTEGRLATARKGGLLGGFVSYGYNYIPKADGCLAHYEINERPAAVVMDMYRWLVEEKMSCRSISVRLKERGIPSPKGKPVWAPSVVNHILRQEVYCGRYYFRRRSPAEPKRPRAKPTVGKTNKTSKRLRPKEDWIRIQTPLIVDRQMWDQAQEQLQVNSKFSPRNNQKHRYLLRQLLRCDICGKAYSGYSVTRRGKAYRYYGCTQKDPLTAPNGRKCPGRSVPADLLEELTWNTVSELLRDPTGLKAEFQRRQSEPEIIDTCQMKRRELRAEIRRLAAQSDRFLDLYGDGKYDRAVLDGKIEQVNAQRRVVENNLKSLDMRKNEADEASQALQNIDAFCKTVEHGLERMSFDERQTLLRLVIDRAIIKVNKIVCIEVAIPLGQPDPVFGLRTIRPTPSPPRKRSSGRLIKFRKPRIDPGAGYHRILGRCRRRSLFPGRMDQGTSAVIGGPDVLNVNCCFVLPLLDSP